MQGNRERFSNKFAESRDWCEPITLENVIFTVEQTVEL